MFPCEKFAKDILPSLRAETVKELIRRGVQKSIIAKQLNITKSAVTQYAKGVRGGSPSKVLKKYAKKIADRLETRKDVKDLLCKACTESGTSPEKC